MKKVVIFISIFLSVICITYIYEKWGCFDVNNRRIKLYSPCFIVPELLYNRMKSFCDCHSDWVHISRLIKQSKQHKILDKTKYIINNFWGTKQLSCGDNSVYSDFDDNEIFLYTKQDTSQLIYDGALTNIRFDDVTYTSSKNLYDAGDNNKLVKVSFDTLEVNYLLDYSSVNIDVLRKFHRFTLYDSSYSTKYKVVNYRLIDKYNDNCIASFLHFNYGKKFYFNVYDINKSK